MAPLTLRHVDPPWRGDCVHGVLEAIRLGFVAADVNAQLLAGLLDFAAAHSGQVGPKGDQNPWKGPGAVAGTSLHKITPDQWVKLVPYAVDAPERPALLSDIIAAVSGEDFVPCFEIKPGEGTHQKAPYTNLKATAVTHQVPIVVMTIQSYGKSKADRATWEASAKLRMKAAAGLPRMLLWRENIPADSDWWQLVEAVKGAPASQKIPANVIRVPATATPATARAVLAKVTGTVDWTPQEVPVVTPLRVDGVDLSHYQAGTLDFAAFAAAGGRFVYHKATEGDTVTDALYIRRMGEVRAAGLAFGAYHYAHPDSSSGVDQAKRFLSVARPMPGDMLPALDLETTGNLSQVELTKWVGAFVGEVKRQLGVLPLIYTNKDLTSDFGCRLWVARYSNSNAAPIMPTPFTRISVRQFSNGVYGVPKSAPGIGNADLDTLPDGVDLADLRIPKAPAPDPTPEVPPVLTIPDPYEVITAKDPISGRTYRVGRRAQAAILALREALGPHLSLYIIQPCYNAGVAASAGTHDKDCCFDVQIMGLTATEADWWRAQRICRENGFFAYFRHTGSWAARSKWHIHMGVLPDPQHVDEWVRHVGIYVPGQRDDYYRHTFGLKGQHNVDLDKSWFPGDPDKAPYPVGTQAQWRTAIDKTVFDYPAWARTQEENMPTPKETRQIVQEEVHKALLTDLVVVVPDDWSDKDKAGQKVSLATAAAMQMKEQIRQRNPKETP